MHIDKLESFWVAVSILLTAIMVGLLATYAIKYNMHPPSNVETIDSSRLHLSEEFNEENLGVKAEGDGVVVTMVAARYGFNPRRIEIPVDTPVKLRIASADVLHGLHVPGSNMATMVVPGYVSEVNTRFSRTGEYSLLCNEYCGLGHDHMWSRLFVTEKQQ